MKTCNYCKNNIELTNFYKNKNTKDGYTSLCKICYMSDERKETIKNQKKKLNEENNKICSTCKKVLNKEKFHKKKSKKDGLASQCRECCKKRKESSWKNKDKILTETNTRMCLMCNETKKYNEFTKNIRKKDGYEIYCKLCLIVRRQKVVKSEKIKEGSSKTCSMCKQENPYINFYKSSYNLDGYVKYCKICYKKYAWNENVRLYRINLRKNDINYRLISNLRGRINYAVKQNSKSDHTKILIGCTIPFLKKHLKSNFQGDMSWDNYGKEKNENGEIISHGWEIDHIKPCSLFDMSKPEEQRKCFNWRNLQPLWKNDNGSKSNNYKFDINHEIKLHFTITF
jgi:hypothetical protein